MGPLMRFGALLIALMFGTASVAADPKPNPYGPLRPAPAPRVDVLEESAPSGNSRENPYTNMLPRRRENPYVLAPAKNNDPMLGPKLPPCNCPPVIVERCPNAR